MRASEERADNEEKLSTASKYETLEKIGKKLPEDNSVTHVPGDKQPLDAVEKVWSGP